MNSLAYSLHAALLGVLCALASPLSGAKLVVPDQRDRQVLETLLLHLLADSKFDMTGVGTKGGTIVLHTRTPEKTGYIQSNQMRHDIGKHSLPGEVERDLRRRNAKPDAKADTYDSVMASFAGLKFTTGIVAADLTDELEGRRRYRGFEKAHPTARGWVEAYLPGYSKDGLRAVVRAFVGPSPHGATVTALLERVGKKWVVKWHHIARYA